MNVRNHLDLKKVLLEDKELRAEYSATKKRLLQSAGEEGINVNEYCVAKTDVILKILKKAGWSDDDLEQVKKLNQ
ncbi:hypothetical protein BJ878DRAFT_494192 [Calycina marina]|uniref:Uncharacterized protein n=1 Tax=Calycina marina TaxID=1763456 RepID=A0A9P7Z8Y4_9HELO|nr:hypothetical protein BJ878DRAFT_494192 [Calycina marina]